MNRPHISINLALSADGKISSVARRPSGWTSKADHERLKQLREPADALMVGRGTLETDRMTLYAPHHPLRCVVSRHGRFDPDHPLFRAAGGPIHLLGTDRAPDTIPDTTAHTGPLEGFLATLHRDLGVRQLHCEGGGELVRALAELDAIDEIHLTWAGHTLFGGAEAPTATGSTVEFLLASRRFHLAGFEPHDGTGECFLRCRRDRSPVTQWS